VNNHAQSYQSYIPDSNVAQSSSSLPASSVHYQQQYNQWPYYYDLSAQTSWGLAVADSTTSVTNVATVVPDYVHLSNQPPPPGTTSWRTDAGNTAAPPAQAGDIQGYQNQYSPKVQVAPVLQNQYINNTAGIPTLHNQYASSAFQHSSANNNQLPDSGTSNGHMVNKVQIPINPQIAPGLPIGMPKVDESNLQADSSLKPAYVCVSMPKNDVKAAQEGSEAVMQVTVGSIYFILFQ